MRLGWFTSTSPASGQHEFVLYPVGLALSGDVETPARYYPSMVAAGAVVSLTSAVGPRW